MLIAIENSLLDVNRPSITADETAAITLKDALSKYCIISPDNILLEETQQLVVRRRKLLQSVVYAVKQPNFSFEKLVRVQFVGEDGVDIGGPRREMLRLLMQAVVNEMGILEGKEQQQYFTHSVDLLEKDTFYLAGKLVRWSLTQGGPGLPVLDQGLYSLMFNEPKPCMPTYDAITDCEVYEKLHKLATCTADTYRSVAHDLAEWAADRGIMGLYDGDFTLRDQILSSLIKQHIFYRPQSGISQFKRGLGNLVNGIEEFPSVFKPLFTMAGCEQLKKEDINNITKYQYSDRGCNRRLQEEDTIYSWELFLQNCEDGNNKTSLEDVLVFITAADKIPPLGFSNPITVDFYTATSSQQKTYPTSSTCALQLQLPRGFGEPQIFMDLMEEAILNSKGFGKL